MLLVAQILEVTSFLNCEKLGFNLLKKITFAETKAYMPQTARKVLYLFLASGQTSSFLFR